MILFVKLFDSYSKPKKGRIQIWEGLERIAELAVSK